MQNPKPMANRNMARYDGNKEVNFPMVGFRGNGSFKAETQTSESFRMTINNLGSSAVDRVIVLCPAHYSDAGKLAARIGKTSCLIIGDGTLDATENKVVTAVGAPTPVEEFLAAIKDDPTRITRMQLNVNNSDQFDESINVVKLRTYKEPERLAPISLTDKQDPNFSNDKLIKFDLNHFQLDNKTIVYFTLKAGRSITFTLYPGAVMDESAYLEAAAKTAYAQLGINRESEN